MKSNSEVFQQSWVTAQVASICLIYTVRNKKVFYFAVWGMFTMDAPALITVLVSTKSDYDPVI